IVVSGLGLITALGDTLESNRAALVRGASGISPLELFKTRHAETLRFGEIKTENKKFAEQLKVSTPGITRTSLLALHAAQQALDDAQLGEPKINSAETALVCASTVG